MTADNEDAQRPDPPDLPPEQLDLYLAVWRSAFINGFVSAGVNAGVRTGLPEGARHAMAHALEGIADQIMRGALHDPISRTVVVEHIQRLVSGSSESNLHYGELSVPCVDPSHHHDEDDR